MRYYPTPAAFRVSPAQERVGMLVSLASILALGYLTWAIPSLQLSVLAVVPLGIFAWFSCSRATYCLAVAQAVTFTYFDYSGAQAAFVNLPVDAALTVLSYLCVVAFILAARRALADSASLREQLAITAENASIQSWLADHDALTSAANRRAFKRAVMHATASASLTPAPFGIIVGDIDNFKAINTRYGHAFGDRLLCTFFSRAQLSCDGMLVGRLDGDQFGALCSGVSSDFGLFGMADKLSHELAMPFMIEEKGIRITVTLATAMYPADARDADALLEIAEKKLYEAKRR